VQSHTWVASFFTHRKAPEDESCRSQRKAGSAGNVFPVARHSQAAAEGRDAAEQVLAGNI
jgi:hypothetical protein